MKIIPLGAALLASLSACATGDRAAPALGSVSPDDLRRHIEILASDDFEGRAPATAGETKTLSYISAQLASFGLVPGAAEGSWYQPVRLVERKPREHRVTWLAGGRSMAFTSKELLLVGREPRRVLREVPVHYVGRGLGEDLAGRSLAGAVVLVQYGDPRDPSLPEFPVRANAIRAAGATAVIGVTDIPWAPVSSYFLRSATALEAEEGPDIVGLMSAQAAAPLIEAAAASGAAPFRASLDVVTSVRPFVSSNVIGRLQGSGNTGESVLLLGHWDHLGLCGKPEAADRICNGAVDNASGIAVMIETARRLARGPRPKRDILVMGTTAEELGLLGARHFAQSPVVPLQSIVAAINADTVAIHPRGTPVAVIGRGVAPLDAAIEETATRLGRALDRDKEADAFVHRQDGWELAAEGVPAVMVGGSFSDMKLLSAFLSGPYHGPEDDLSRPLVLDGAAEDADLTVALVRRLADPELYQPPKR